MKAFVGYKKIQDSLWQFDLKFMVSLKINAILQSLTILQFSQHLSDLSNKIFRDKVWCILDVSENYLSSIQDAFRGLHNILQGESQVLNWKRINKKVIDSDKKLSFAKFKSNSKCRCSPKTFAWPSSVFISPTLTSFHSFFDICLRFSIYLSRQILKISLFINK